jgi:F-type H+-transporting ATPase subunit gamma
MSTLIDLRRRIKSVRNSQQITQAMKTVATAKFKKSQRLMFEARPFLHSLPDLLSKVAFWAGQSAHPLLARREEQKIEGVVIASDKGLCGALNSNLLAEALSFLTEKSKQSEVRLVLLGKKAVNFFKKHSFPIDRVYQDKVDKLGFKDFKEIAQFLVRLYVFNRTDAVYVAYNEFRSILSPRITIARVLPLHLPRTESEKQFFLPPDWEPEARSLLDTLLPIYMENQIFHCLVESQAAEHAARMMAMDNATQNAEELISDLVLILNKIRQASITKELLEIMTAVEALAK